MAKPIAVLSNVGRMGFAKRLNPSYDLTSSRGGAGGERGPGLRFTLHPGYGLR